MLVIHPAWISVCRLPNGWSRPTFLPSRISICKLPVVVCITIKNFRHHFMIISFNYYRCPNRSSVLLVSIWPCLWCLFAWYACVPCCFNLYLSVSGLSAFLLSIVASHSLPCGLMPLLGTATLSRIHGWGWWEGGGVRKVYLLLRCCCGFKGTVSSV
jgi:hypothetical protein